MNNLCFAADTILFTSGRVKSLQLIMQTLKTYQDTFVQLINCDKSNFMVHQNAFESTNDRIKRNTGFKQKQGITSYLGCPLFKGRPRIPYFSDLVSKVICMITGWKTKQLNYGGRFVLIKHVLQAFPIHLISAIPPSGTLLKQIKMLMTNFFLGWKSDKKKHH